MEKAISNNFDNEVESIKHLLQAIRKDPIINKKVKKILKMNSYSRRFVLNTWLEELRLNNAPGKLTETLSMLFDDNIAQKTLYLISR